MEFINFGKVVNVSASVPTAIDDATYHIIIDFVPDDPNIFDDFHDNMDEILKHPDNYVLCNIEDIVKRIKEKQAFEDRIKELEGQLADAKKESDKKLCEAYMETNATLCKGAEALYKSADKLMSIDKTIADLKKDRDHWKRNYKTLAEYWDNTYKDIVATGKKVGVKIDLKGRKPDGNTGTVYVTNEKAIELAYKLNTARQIDDKKWQAMLNELKDNGVEVLYMGEEGGKPIIDVKIPEIGDLRKELEDLKSKTVAEARYELKPDCLTLIYTMCDGSEQVFGMDLSESVDATSISCGTVPKCKSCSHFMHNPSRFTHDWCYMPVAKESGAGYIRKLNKEESEGPACSDFKARKE